MARVPHQGNVGEAPRITPLVDEQRRITLAWLGFLQTLVGAAEPGKIEDMVDIVTEAFPDPYTYIASIPCHVLILGGTFNSAELTRGRVTIDISTTLGTFIPMGLKDELTIDCSVVPDHFWFIPSIPVQQGVM